MTEQEQTYRKRETSHDNQTFREALTSRVDELDSQIARLEARLQDAHADARSEHQPTLDDLRAQQRQFEHRVKEYDRAPHQGRSALQTQLDEAWHGMTTAVERARLHIEKPPRGTG